MRLVSGCARRSLGRNDAGSTDPEIHLIPAGCAGEDTPANRTDPEVQVFNPIRGYIQAGLRPCDIEYEQYFVGTKAQLLDRSDANQSRVIKYVQDTFKCL
jgi:hypothetical protein